MSTRGRIFYVNTTGIDFTIEVKGKKMWHSYTAYSGTTKTGTHKIANANSYPFKKTKREGVILNKKTKEEIWRGKFKYIVPGFDTISCAGVIIADNPTGDGFLIEIIDFGNIIAFLLKYFGIGYYNIMGEIIEEINDLKDKSKIDENHKIEYNSIDFNILKKPCNIDIKYKDSINPHIDDLKYIVEKRGGIFEGDYNSGKAFGNNPFNYEIEYLVDSPLSSINLKITKKPFFLSCSRIKKELEVYLNNKNNKF